jgi:hypothetical protein
MKNKWVWISLGVATGGTALFFLGRFIKNKYFPNPLDEKDINNAGRPTQGGTPSTSTSSALPPTPFTNTTEGNAFRAWVNDNYPAYAQEIDLDRTGQYDNSYIRKAYVKYGAVYQQALSNGTAVAKPTSADFTKLSALVGAFPKLVNSASKLQIATSDDRPRILIDFYPEGLMVVQKDSSFWSSVYAKVSGSWKIQNGNAVLDFDGGIYTLTPTDNNAIWGMLKDGGYLSVQDGSFIPFEGGMYEQTQMQIMEEPSMYQQTQMPSYIQGNIRNKKSLIGDLENELENF